jgi:DNA processing protein
MSTTHDEEYVPPGKIDMLTVASERVGITNGLWLKFPQIHGVGDFSLLERPRIAIVGARKATQEGRRRAAQLARDCARAGVVVVSGLAEGIDHAAHTAAIEHGGSTLSPFTWGDKFVPSNFPERNRIMAHLALATVIIEASDTSGTLHQAAESVQVGRPVFIAAGMLEDAKLRWPKRFIGDDKPFGRTLRTTSDVIDFALATRAP